MHNCPFHVVHAFLCCLIVSSEFYMQTIKKDLLCNCPQSSHRERTRSSRCQYKNITIFLKVEVAVPDLAKDIQIDVIDFEIFGRLMEYFCDFLWNYFKSRVVLWYYRNIRSNLVMCNAADSALCCSRLTLQQVQSCTHQYLSIFWGTLLGIYFSRAVMSLVSKHPGAFRSIKRCKLDLINVYFDWFLLPWFSFTPWLNFR
jgi:hypothetical protein